MKTEKILINASLAAEMLSMSKSFFYQMVSAGRLPAPLKFGRKSLWSAKTLREFIDEKSK